MSKKLSRKLGVISILSLISLSLVACDPPMPPELLAQIAEENPTCIAGDVPIVADGNTETVVASWVESLAATCADPASEMTISLGSDTTKTSIKVSGNIASSETPYVSVPIALDAGVIAYNLPGLDSINVSYATMAAILNGKVANWKDKYLVKDNPGTELPDLPLKIRLEAEANSLSALAELLGQHKLSFSLNTFKAVNSATLRSLTLAEGEIAIESNSLAVFQGAPTLGVVVGGKNQETGDLNIATATSESIASAGTQLEILKQSQTVHVKLNTRLEAKPAVEGESVAIPYQAIFPINMYLLGGDELLTRAAAAFCLRLDSQGALGYANLNQLPESVRFEALALVRKGLPTPKVTKQSE